MNGKLWWSVLAMLVVVQSGVLGWIVSRQFIGLERVVVIERELGKMDADLDKEVAKLAFQLEELRADMQKLEGDVGWIYRSHFADERK